MFTTPAPLLAKGIDPMITICGACVVSFLLLVAPLCAMKSSQNTTAFITDSKKRAEITNESKTATTISELIKAYLGEDGPIFNTIVSRKSLDYSTIQLLYTDSCFIQLSQASDGDLCVYHNKKNIRKKVCRIINPIDKKTPHFAVLAFLGNNKFVGGNKNLYTFTADLTHFNDKNQHIMTDVVLDKQLSLDKLGFENNHEDPWDDLMACEIKSIIPLSNTLVLLNNRRRIIAYDMQAKQCKHIWKQDNLEAFIGNLCSCNNNAIYCNIGKKIYVYDPIKNEATNITETARYISYITVLENGKLACGHTEPCGFTLIDPKTLCSSTYHELIKGPHHSIKSIITSNNGRSLVVGINDGTLLTLEEDETISNISKTPATNRVCCCTIS